MGSQDFGRSEGRWDSQTLSLTLGRLCGIRIRAHITLPLAFFVLLSAFSPFWGLALLLGAVLFAIVFLHELGHCFGCRAVGGRADDVLLGPLGGLAFVDPPHRPAEYALTTLAGPAVNVLLLVAMLPVAYVQGYLSASLVNPIAINDLSGPAMFGFECFRLNYLLLLFNLLPIYPLDGGRLLQAALWHRLGYVHASILSTNVGMAAGAILAILGVYLAGAWGHIYLILTVVGAAAVVDSFRFRRQIELTGGMPENEFGYDFSQGYTSLERSMPRSKGAAVFPSLRARVGDWLRRRRESQEAHIEAELDRILEKIHSFGIESLSREERKLLTQASKRRRSRS